MIDTVLNLVFRCAHRRLTRPVTSHAETYVVCLECGKQFPYDAKEMHIVPAGDAAEPAIKRVARALFAAIPAAIVFCLTLFHIRRDRK